MRRMQKVFRIVGFAVAGTIVIGVIAGRAQGVDPSGRIAVATALMSMDQIDQKPWHMKLDVTLFDERGNNPSQGTIEVWHAGADERTVYMFGDASKTSLKRDDKYYGASSGPSLPFEADEVLQQVLHPGPASDELAGSKPELRKQKFGNVQLDCIMLTQPIKGTGEIPLGLFPTYCLDADGFIRSTYDFGSRTVVVSGVGKFLEHDIPTHLDILNDRTIVASAKIIMLATYTPQPQEFVPAADMKSADNAARISGGVIAGNRVNFVQPVYPQSMKAGHISGTVVLRAIIGRDGHVYSLRPINAADPEFMIAAIAAVRQWIYKPYMLNGEPTRVYTTITVNFALNAR